DELTVASGLLPSRNDEAEGDYSEAHLPFIRFRRHQMFLPNMDTRHVLDLSNSGRVSATLYKSSPPMITPVHLSSEHVNETHGRPETGGEDDIFKVWGLDDPFLYAPERPDGDPWNILLRPLLDKDKQQCASWADEVQNLLIFAGLFSSVVTAFVIESYRNLKPSSDDTMVFLLSRIANRLDNPLNVTASFPSMAGLEPIPFSPTSSSIRTNTLWFISLVLSLATVLVGTISLQWLREHQSYPDLSPKQTFALFHLRSSGLREWHVSKLFTILPLFLQCAVVLFLAGLIDFLVENGNYDVLIPVSAVIGFTLLFLLCTTALPTLQGAAVYFRRSWAGRHSAVPNQCPYKSPQSYIFRNISSIVLQLILHIYPSFHTFLRKVYRLLSSPAEITTSVSDSVSRHISNTWMPQTTWTQFDLAWLSLRDVCMRNVYGRATEVINLGQEPHKSFPMYDAIRALQESLQDTATFSAQYHCFSELSEGIFPREHIPAETWDKYKTENEYFQDLLATDQDRAVSLSDFFKLNGPKKFQERYQSLDIHPSQTNTAKAVHHENLHMFIDHMYCHHPFDDRLSKHMLEIKLRLLGYFYHEQAYEPQPQVLASTYSPALPACLATKASVLQFTLNRPPTDSFHKVFYFECGSIFYAFFQRVSDDTNVRSSIPSIIHPHLPYFLRVGRRAIINASPTVSGRRSDCDGFITTFTFIMERLDQELATADIEGQPSLLFYVAALFAKGLVVSYFGPNLRLLLSTLHEYKRKTIDKGIINTELEEQFRLPAIYGPHVFSQEWWVFLNVHTST
ncbi:hypothetical protein CVT25_015366, partial [Psilocybe cyanescens]